MLLIASAINSASAKTWFNFDIPSRDRLLLHGPVATVKTVSNEIHDGKEMPATGVETLAFTNNGHLCRCSEGNTTVRPDTMLSVSELYTVYYADSSGGAPQYVNSEFHASKETVVPPKQDLSVLAHEAQLFLSNKSRLLTAAREGSLWRMVDKTVLIRQGEQELADTRHRFRFTAMPGAVVLEELAPGNDAAGSGIVINQAWLDLSKNVLHEQSFDEQGRVDTVHTYSFDKYGNLTRYTETPRYQRTTRISTYTYTNFDSHNNWTRCNEMRSYPQTEREKPALARVVRRTLTYHDAPATNTRILEVGSFLTHPELPQSVVVKHLIAALEQHPQQQRFRIAWEIGGFGGGAGYAIYDRQQRTVAIWTDTGTVESHETSFQVIGNVSLNELHRLLVNSAEINVFTGGALLDHLDTVGGITECGWSYTQRW